MYGEAMLGGESIVLVLVGGEDYKEEMLEEFGSFDDVVRFGGA